MKALFVGSDQTIFDYESPARKRLRTYASHIGELHVLARSGMGHVPYEQDSTEKRLFIYGARSSKLFVPFIFSRYAHKLIDTHHIDIVSAHDPFEYGWAAARAVKGTNAKLHIQVHTDYLSPWFTRNRIFRSPNVRMPFLNGIRIRIAHNVLTNADGIRTVSKRVKDSMLARYGNAIPEPSVVPDCGPVEIPPKTELPPRPFTFTLVTVNRLKPEKRIPDLLAVLKRLKDVYPMIGLVIIGEGPERKRLERLTTKWGLSEHVLFLGWRADAWGLVQDAQAYIQASAYEGYGLSLIKAALAGIPIITSDVGVVGEVFIGYEHVFAAPVGDPTNLAALTAQLIEDPHARTLLSIEAKRVAHDHLETYKDQPALIAADLQRLIT